MNRTMVVVEECVAMEERRRPDEGGEIVRWLSEISLQP